MRTTEWLTPQSILSRLGEFDLDPCSPVVRPWPTARRHYTIMDDGLAQVWEGRVFLNPTFGQQAMPWMLRMRDHGNGIALLPARTETELFYATVWGHANGVCFLRGRPHFCHVTGERSRYNSGCPIVLIAYGGHNLGVLIRSGLGYVVRLTT